jgi:hypothetical protein
MLLLSIYTIEGKQLTLRQNTKNKSETGTLLILIIPCSETKSISKLTKQKKEMMIFF